ncbi:biotin transporter BioY [Benzoatithermus flavus]|uniref:Biotin transporter n=1 Tax=Benzoatithermus flavus TaxID=3108223 RepID=A0ABU8XTQ2_9PROT
MPEAPAVPTPAALPLRLEGARLATKTLVVALGTLVLAASSWIEVPMVPVPMTMQTYAVLLVGALCGWRLALATVLAWLGEAMVGLPVLAGGAGGLAHFAGPTGGYLVSFPLAAALVGLLAERGWTKRVLPAFAVMLAGHGVIFALGVSWLATRIGLAQAIAFGLTPFLLGTVLKSALAVATLRVVPHGRRAR